GLGQAGAAAIAGPTQAIQNTMFGYTRAQEDQADRAAVKFLTATGQSPKGMYETFKRLADQTLSQSRRLNPHMQAHPLPSERVAALEGAARQSPYWDHKDPPALQARHDLMRAKLYGFLERPEAVARRYPASETSLPQRLARATSPPIAIPTRAPRRPRSTPSSRPSRKTRISTNSRARRCWRAASPP